MGFFLLIIFSVFAQVKVDSSQLSVSGISSGAQMATQLHIAYSDYFSGVGLIAGGPYGCAGGNALTAQYQCMKNDWGEPSVEILLGRAYFFEQIKRISNLSQIPDDKIFLLSGTNDQTVLPENMLAAKVFYESLGVTKIKSVFDMPVGHAFPTVSSGHDCDNAGKAPWLAACGRNIAKEMLSHLFQKKLKTKSAPTDNYYRYQQSDAVSMAREGVIYFPKSCFKKKCPLHIALHGCAQNLEAVGNDFVMESGLNEVAEGSNLIILYPQTKALGLINPHGCWDWWGYSGLNYLWRDSSQMSSILNTVNKLISGRLTLFPLF